MYNSNMKTTVSFLWNIISAWLISINVWWKIEDSCVSRFNSAVEESVKLSTRSWAVSYPTNNRSGGPTHFRLYRDRIWRAFARCWRKGIQCFGGDSGSNLYVLLLSGQWFMWNVAPALCNASGSTSTKIDSYHETMTLYVWSPLPSAGLSAVLSSLPALCEDFLPLLFSSYPFPLLSFLPFPPRPCPVFSVCFHFIILKENRSEWAPVALCIYRNGI